MKIVLFYHSLVSDWNHGNAHFLRGVARELQARGHELAIYEPRDGWSRTSLVREQGARAIDGFRRAFPDLRSRLYDVRRFDLDRALDGADLVIVHEWSSHDLVRRIGQHHRRHPGYRLLFHDTHHRSVTDPESMSAYDLSWYDGVLAFGEAVRRIYLERGWAERAWTWHEAADATVFRPLHPAPKLHDLVWVGNWGDDERTAELREFLFEPVRALGASARVCGVRYPPEALATLEECGIRYGGWIPNHQVPALFAAARCTVHVPRRPYVRALPGIPTIRVFEALACGIPLVSAPWDDAEGLFRPGRDYLVARDGGEMTELLRELLADPALRAQLARNGRRAVLERHTCAHRVDELLRIHAELDGAARDAAPLRAAAAEAGEDGLARTAS